LEMTRVLLITELELKAIILQKWTKGWDSQCQNQQVVS